MNRRLYLSIERVIIAVMMISIVAMFQPFSIALYGLGFPSLLAATLAFIVFSHVPTRD